MRRLITMLLCAVLFSTYAKAQPDTAAAMYDSLRDVISDRSIPFEKKYETVSANTFHLQPEQLFDILSRLAALADAEGEKGKALGLYGTILRHKAHRQQLDDAQLYADTVASYMRYAKEPAENADANFSIATYYQTLGDFENSSRYFLDALSFYEQVGGSEITQSDILYALGAMYVYLRDTVNLKTIADKLGPLAEKIGDLPAEVSYGTIMQEYYRILYEEDETRTEFLELVIKHGERMLRAYESVDNPPPNYGYHIAYNYVSQAEYILKEHTPDMKKVRRYLDKASEIAYPGDNILEINYHNVNALYWTELKNYDMAESEAFKTLALMDAITESQESLYNTYEISYKLMTIVYEARGDYKNAYEYEKKRAKYKELILNTDRQRVLQDMQTKYEVENKERDIERLTNETIYQSRIKYLILGISVLLIIAASAVIMWLRSKRKADSIALKMAKLKQQEAELETELEKVKREEKENEYQSLLNEVQHKQIRSYIEGLEMERTRLAKELHDDVSNGMVALRMKIEGNELSKEELIGSLQSLHSLVRGMSHDMMPPMFRYATLPDIMADYVSSQGKVKKTAISFTSDESSDYSELPADKALEIYRIMQEAVANAMKFSDADRIDVSLYSKGGEIHLTVSDDGKGFDTERDYRGIGLKTMRDRAEGLRAKMEIVSEKNKGTTISVIYSLEK